MIKKHPFVTILLILVSILLLYLLFNMLSPHFINHIQEDVVKIKGIEYEYRLDWMIIEKDKYVGIVSPDSINFWKRIDLFPRRLYEVKGDENNISYYYAPSLITEFPWGEHLYRKDIELPNIANINPSRIELGRYSYDLENETYYYTEDKQLIDEIISVIRDDEPMDMEYSQEAIEQLKKIKAEDYNIYFFTESVPGSTYELFTRFDGYKTYIDINTNNLEEEMKDVTHAIYKIITEGKKIETD